MAKTTFMIEYTEEEKALGYENAKVECEHDLYSNIHTFHRLYKTFLTWKTFFITEELQEALREED